MNDRTRRCVGYVRVSSDDKDQRPERQVDFLTDYAARHDLEVVAWVIDEGTSATKVPPLQRQKVHEALREARKNGAKYLLVENLDRWSRGGNKEVAVTEVRLDVEHGVEVIMADMPTGMDGLAYEIIKAVKAEMAREYARLMGERIKQGLALAKKNGWPKGQPGNAGKPSLSADERVYVAELRARKPPLGWRRVALAVSDRRGAFELADPKARKKRAVSATWVEYQFTQGGKPGASEAERKPNATTGLRRNGPMLTVMQTTEQAGER